MKQAVDEALEEQGLSRKTIEALAGQLLWRVGRVSDDSPVTVRVGFATDAAAFAELPRLRNATDAEVEVAIAEGEVRVEWVARRG